MTKDLHHRINTFLSLAPIKCTTTTNGTVIDTKGYESVEILYVIGQSGDTLGSSVKITPSLQDSDASDSGFTDTTEIIGELTVIDSADKDEVIQRIGYKGRKRYLKPILTFTGTHTNGTPCSIVAVLGHARRG